MNTEFLVGMIIDFTARMAHILSSRRVTLSLVTRPLFLFSPRIVIIHGCSEGPGNGHSVGAASRTHHGF